MATQLLTTLDALARDARRDAASPQCPSLLARVIGFVGVQLGGPLAGSPAHALNRLDGVQRLFQHLDVMDISCRDSHRERDALALDHKMALRARFAAIRRILPGFSAPPLRRRSKNPTRRVTSQCDRLGRGGLTRPGATYARLRPRAIL